MATNKLKLLFGWLILMAAPLTQAVTIFEDNFESGTASSYWTAFSWVSVQPLPPETGRSGKALQFKYKGNIDDTVDATAEARFDLKKIYTTVLIEFDLFIPANYRHMKPSDKIDNNKLLRMWQVNYGEGEQAGAGTLSQGTLGESRVGSDYKIKPEYGMSTGCLSANDFITTSDFGKWMTVKIYVEAPTDTTYGKIRIYKNNMLLLSDNNFRNVSVGSHGWRYGYLFGWANSGFREDTILYVDNVKFSEGSPPRAPLVQ